MATSATTTPVDELLTFWCSDCASDALFERLSTDAERAVTLEWACTSCGAAYMDGIGQLDVDVSPTAARRAS